VASDIDSRLLARGVVVGEKTLTQADNGTTVQARPGDRIVIRLTENPTTGYRWSPDAIDDRIVSLISTESTPPTGGGVGGSGSVTLVFEARAMGEGSIRLKRWRDWEGESSVRERYAIKVRVDTE
jgi:inhibitor of cysteine peptidase